MKHILILLGLSLVLSSAFSQTRITYLATDSRVIKSPQSLTTFGDYLFFGATGSVAGSEPLAIKNSTRIEYHIHANAATEFVQIETKEDIRELQVLDLTSRLSYAISNPDHNINVSFLVRGPYVFNVSLKSGYTHQKQLFQNTKHLLFTL